ncbi:MAG: hypothetical protein IJ311_00700 [Elusimicrobiaceae bacterium]|nr:hypothetical protein [Elusimicrobiaceae bacterium]
MSNHQKAKTAGKIIIVVLSLAILFFLLLPFLDHPAASGSSGAKKATPQIFTSNPLSELVQKVFALFKKDKPQAPTYPAEMTDEMLASLTPEEQQKYALQRSEEKDASNFEYSSEVDASYNYGEAGMVNEDGEWILVRQTAPESANPGMHEVNTRDNAYEQYIRQERAARYTGKAGADAGPVIPDSKWARLWKPIKAFFTGKDEDVSANNSPQSTEQENAYLLASSGSGLGKDDYKQGNIYRRGQSADIPASAWEFGNGESVSLDDMLNPETSLNNIIAAYKEMAKKTLTPQQYEKFAKEVDGIKDRNRRELIELTKQQLWKNLEAEAAKDKPQNFIEKTLLASACNSVPKSASFSSLYNTSDEKDQNCKNYQPAANQEQSQQTEQGLLQKNNQKANETKERKKEAFKEFFTRPDSKREFDEKSLRMLVVLGKTEEAPFRDKFKSQAYDEYGEEILPENMSEEQKEEQRKLKFQEEISDYIFQKQGCGKGKPCYWVGGEYLGSNPELRHSVESSGMEYLGDPLNVIQPLLAEYMEQKISEGTEEEVDEFLQVQKNPDFLNNVLYYVPYNAQNMEELNKRNRHRSEDSFYYYIPSAANAVAMQEELPQPFRVIYDDTDGTVLDKAQNIDFTQRGEKIHQQVKERYAEIHGIAHDTGLIQRTHQECGERYLHYHSQNIREEMQQHANEHIEDQMNLPSNK